jgi:hypothetical protein
LQLKVVDGQCKVFCTHHREANKNTSYANGGSKKLQHSAIDRHQINLVYSYEKLPVLLLICNQPVITCRV